MRTFSRLTNYHDDEKKKEKKEKINQTSVEENSVLRAAACKYQTSPDIWKKSTSILFHEKNPYIELFSKMEFLRISFFKKSSYLRFRPDEAWR